MQRVLRSIVWMAVLAAVAAGCGNDAPEEATEQAMESAIRSSGQEGDVEVDAGTMKITTADGQMTFGEGTKLPDNWPDDVPVYEGLKLLTAMTAPEGSTIQGTTTDSLDKVTEFYKDRVTKDGWTEQTTMTQPQMSMLSYTKEQRTLVVTIGAADAETSVSLTVSGQ